MFLTLEFLQRIYKTGFWLVLILILLDLLFFFYYPENSLGDIFLATREQTPLTWISALTFLFIALSSLSAYLETGNKKWYFLSVIFFFFSMDDATYFHERFTGYLVNNIDQLSSFPSYSWIILYFPLLFFSLGVFIWLLWKNSSKRNRRFVILGLVLLGIAVFLDLIDGITQKNSSVVFSLTAYGQEVFLHLIRLTEEVLEVFALGLLGYINLKKHCLHRKNVKQSIGGNEKI
ncbi:MAG: hypothetical protein U5L10_04100 [Candidatus Moranbacteria bacterium]|nr:hypothetical protein [Candidatus Moranbacteria bacterium]